MRGTTYFTIRDSKICGARIPIGGIPFIINDVDGNPVPGEGFEPPTFGLQNRCTTTVLTRRAAATYQIARRAGRGIRHGLGAGAGAAAPRSAPRRGGRPETTSNAIGRRMIHTYWGRLTVEFLDASG